MQGVTEADYSPTPGADASSQSSPGSASDHMGMQFSGAAATTFGVQPNFPGSAALAAFDAEKHNHVNRVITTSPAVPQEKPTAVSRRKKEGLSPAASGTTVRRQKRLQRNRESARLSRRRRKQYLEELEERVDKLSESLDQSRRQHVAQAISVLKEKRVALLSAPNSLASLSVLETSLSRTNEEIMIATTFQAQQLKSFSASPSTQFVLWLTLQTDAFFRGGRAASERLSAARIGERVRRPRLLDRENCRRF
jgi:bZIP transcription factor